MDYARTRARTNWPEIKVPPHSIEAEQSVLGGLMLDNNAWDTVAETVVEDNFYRHDHRLVYPHYDVS